MSTTDWRGFQIALYDFNDLLCHYPIPKPAVVARAWTTLERLTTLLFPLFGYFFEPAVVVGVAFAVGQGASLCILVIEHCRCLRRTCM